jgi:hypothetical protein
MKTGLSVAATILSAALVPPPLEAAPCEPLPLPSIRIRTVRTAAALEDAVRNARADSAIVLEDGIYQLSGPLEIRAPGLIIRGRSADPTRTVIKGQGMLRDAVGVALGVSAPRVTVAHLSIGQTRFHAVQVRGESGASSVRVYGVRLFDTGQQLLKGSYAPGAAADEGRVECSTFEYSDRAPSDYTNGVDLIGTKDWVIRDNRFLRIRGPQEKGSAAGPAILVWGGAEGTIVERNVLIDCFRGIALGLGPGAFATPRPGAGEADHRGGVVRQNVVVNLHSWADEGIEANAAPGVRVEFNTVLVEGQLPWSISLRFGPTSAVVRNNLTSRRILSRDGGRFVDEGNVQGAARNWFVDVASGNLRLAGPDVKAIDAGVPASDPAEDFDGLPRTIGPRPDAGAFEYPGIRPGAEGAEGTLFPSPAAREPIDQRRPARLGPGRGRRAAVGREPAVRAGEIEVAADFGHDVAADRPAPEGKTADERVVAQHVDGARDPARRGMNQRDGLPGEQVGRVAPCRPDARDDIGGRVRQIERGDLAPERHALLQLAQLERVQTLGQLGLPGQDDRQQLLLRRFDVGEQADLLEQLEAQALRLVDDERRDLVARAARAKLGLERSDQARLGRGRLGGELQPRGEELDELRAGERRVVAHDWPDMATAARLKRRAQDRRLAGARLAHDHGDRLCGR